MSEFEGQKPIRILKKASGQSELVRHMIKLGNSYGLKGVKVTAIFGPYKDEETGDSLYLLNLVEATDDH